MKPGADFVRLTAQGIREAENLALIKKELRKAGFETPLIADIHFNPLAAETAARIVEKVRINPGNYADKRASFENREFTEKEYADELGRIHSRLLPLINICRENKTVIRLGINHGSLSDRIMTRFGNTPKGMVFSAMEFIRIFRAENFHDLVLSMKSSDTAVMIESTRMLVSMLQDESLAYPIHLGVTEAGEGEDGRIRSAAGIGALLAEGIGDTIRVSLSEDPEMEIPVARKLAEYYPRGISDKAPDRSVNYKTPPVPEIFRRINGPLVVSDMTFEDIHDESIYINAGYKKDSSNRELIKTDSSSDLVIVRNLPEKIAPSVSLVLPYNIWHENRDVENLYPLFTQETLHLNKNISSDLSVITADPSVNVELLKNIDSASTLIIFRFNPETEPYAPDFFLNSLEQRQIGLNIILSPAFRENIKEDLQIKAAALLGRYVIDRRVCGISLTNTGRLN